MTTPDFSLYAFKRDLDDEKFPHARLGFILFRVMKSLFGYGLVFAIIGGLIWFGSSFIPSIDPLTVEGFTLDSDVYMGNFKSFLMGAGIFIASIGGFLWLLMFITITMYMVVTVMRWRAWERGCFFNDFRADHLRKSLLNSLNVDKYLREAKKSMRGSQDSDKSGDASRSTESKVEAYKAIKKTRVYVNSRQSLDFDDVVLRYYRIIIELPYSSDAVEETKRMVNGMGVSANRVAKLKFGDAVLSEDDRHVQFDDRMKIKDRYKREATSQSKDASESKYEYSFSLDCFADNSHKIGALKQKAQRWADQQADVLDDLLFTQDVKGRRLRTVVGSSTATVVYDMSFSKDMAQFDSKEKTIDQTFKISGTKITIDSGELMVTIPLPTDRKLPIDNKTLYSSVFGEPEPMKKLETVA